MSRQRNAKLLALVIRDAITESHIYNMNKKIVNSIVNRYILLDRHHIFEECLSNRYEMNDTDNNLITSVTKATAKVWDPPMEACKGIEANESFQTSVNENINRFLVWPGLNLSKNKKKRDTYSGYGRNLQDIKSIHLKLGSPDLNNSNAKEWILSKLKVLDIMKNGTADASSPNTLFLHVGVERDFYYLTLRRHGDFLHNSVGIRWYVIQKKFSNKQESAEKNLSDLLDVFIVDYMTWNRRQVKWIQEKLKAHGYFRDKIDGIFGKNTEKAIKIYQKTNNLRQTGIIDIRTAKILGLL